MPRFGGIDLTQTQWRITEFPLEVPDVRSHAAQTPPGAAAGGSRSCKFNKTRTFARIKQTYYHPSRHHAEDNALTPWLLPSSGAIKRAMRSWKIAGLTHPYHAVPAVRRALKRLVETTFGAMIDAPLASCLGLLADGQLTAPANVLILTGSPQDPELTAVGLTLADSDLEMRVCASVQLPVQAESAAFTARGSTFEAQLSRYPLTSWELRVCGQELTEIGSRVASQLGVPPTADGADATAAARGAAGFAYYQHQIFEARRNNRMPATTFPGTDITSIRVHHIFPRSVGIIGAGSRPGEAFWRRLFEAGQSLETRPDLVLPAGHGVPEVVMLAEWDDDGKDDLLWASDPSDANDFRSLYLYSSYKTPPELNDKLTAVVREGDESGDEREVPLIFTVENPSGMERWSEQLLHVH
ncbi:MAG: hypothetical protein ACC628_22400 [Pirellulaceae bacterium]